VYGKINVAKSIPVSVAVRFVKKEGWSFYVNGKRDFTYRGNSKDIDGQYFSIGADSGWAGKANKGKIDCFKYSTQTGAFANLLRDANYAVNPPVAIDDSDMR